MKIVAFERLGGGEEAVISHSTSLHIHFIINNW